MSKHRRTWSTGGENKQSGWKLLYWLFISALALVTLILFTACSLVSSDQRFGYEKEMFLRSRFRFCKQKLRFCRELDADLISEVCFWILWLG